MLSDLKSKFPNKSETSVVISALRDLRRGRWCSSGYTWHTLNRKERKKKEWNLSQFNTSYPPPPISPPIDWTFWSHLHAVGRLFRRWISCSGLETQLYVQVFVAHSAEWGGGCGRGLRAWTRCISLTQKKMLREQLFSFALSSSALKFFSFD